MKPVIGIDLGTTNCTLAYTRGESVDQFAIPQLVHQIKDRQFALRIGERAQFRLFQSTERKQDAPGEMLEEIAPEMEELTPVEVSLPGNAGETVPVTLESLVTETGMLELWFVASDGRRWKLDFNVRPRRGISNTKRQ